MILTAENLVYYLLERGLITRDAVVNGGLKISEVSRRNRNFQIKQSNGPGYFLKQVRRWEPDAIRTLKAEAECYKLAAADENFADIAQVIPRFRFYDQRRSALITELLDGAETVTQHHFRNDAFPVEVAQQLGQAFGSYHGKAAGTPPSAMDGTFLRRPAWALSLHEMPAHSLPDLSGGIHQMLGMIRQFPEFAVALNKLRSEWRSDAVIHGDIKWENCLLCPSSDGLLCLKIVDWEMADWGDSCWDVAAIFSAYISFWVQSLPTNGVSHPDAMLMLARFPIEKMQPAIRAFWETYAECRQISGENARRLLRRTVLYTGARGLQTVFEVLQMAPQADSRTVLMLQLSMNVLAKPDDAARELLGIEP